MVGLLFGASPWGGGLGMSHLDDTLEGFSLVLTRRVGGGGVRGEGRLGLSAQTAAPPAPAPGEAAEDGWML